MDKPDIEWIDKLFNCMGEFYQKRWSKQFDRWFPESLLKVQWQSALQGLTYDEIRGVLVLLKQAAKNPYAEPPSHLEFYAYAKGTKRPFIPHKAVYANRANSEVARRALDEIHKKLRGKKSIECST